MRAIVLVSCLAYIFMHTNSAVDITQIRKLYYQAADRETASRKLVENLAAVNELSAPVLLCYKGAATMMEAKYTFSPFTKLNKFNNGKTLIEAAIKIDSEQVEMRFIRFSIQTNLPRLLGYYHHIQADKEMLVSAVAGMEDQVLKQNIVNYLILSKRCTAKELEQIQK